MNLRLTNDQTALLKEVLTDHLSDLRMEIAETEDHDLRRVLKRNEAMIVDLLGQLGVHLQVGQDLRGLA